MSTEQLYVLRSLTSATNYVCERAGSFGCMGPIEEAMRHPRSWWEKELAPGWEKHFTLEAVQ